MPLDEHRRKRNPKRTLRHIPPRVSAAVGTSRCAKALAERMAADDPSGVVGDG